MGPVALPSLCSLSVVESPCHPFNLKQLLLPTR